MNFGGTAICTASAFRVMPVSFSRLQNRLIYNISCHETYVLILLHPSEKDCIRIEASPVFAIFMRAGGPGAVHASHATTQVEAGARSHAHRQLLVNRKQKRIRGFTIHANCKPFGCHKARNKAIRDFRAQGESNQGLADLSFPYP